MQRSFWISTLIVGCVIQLLALFRYRQRIEALRVQATTDSLTGLLNRGQFLRLAQRAEARASLNGQPSTLLLLDLDHFKQVNDTRGHAVGDAVLSGFADRCAAQLRTHDLIGRIGGEEFAVLLPGTDQNDGTVIAERLRQTVAASPIAGVPVTVSIGVAAARASLDDTMHGADMALYEAKRSGRDRVVVYEPAALVGMLELTRTCVRVAGEGGAR